jgi:hypothetical protein
MSASSNATTATPQRNTSAANKNARKRAKTVSRHAVYDAAVRRHSDAKACVAAERNRVSVGSSMSPEHLSFVCDQRLTSTSCASMREVYASWRPQTMAQTIELLMQFVHGAPTDVPMVLGDVVPKGFNRDSLAYSVVTCSAHCKRVLRLGLSGLG